MAQQAKDLGVDVTDVRILRAELPAETSQAIYERMTSERVREAKELRAQGFEWAQEIRSKADRDRAVLLSDSLRKSETERGAADAEANRIAVAAYGQNPEFYDLYRTLQVYRSALTQGSPTFVLAPSNELMKFFDAGPDARKAKAAGNPAGVGVNRVRRRHDPVSRRLAGGLAPPRTHRDLLGIFPGLLRQVHRRGRG